MGNFRIYEYGTAVKGTVFIFGGWRINTLPYRRGIHDMNKLGYKCVLYLPDPKLLNIGTQHIEIVRATEQAVRMVQTYIKEDATPIAHYMIMGMSLGSAFAIQAAKECEDVQALVLLAPFGDFSKHMERWLDHRYFGRLARSQHTPIAESVAILNQISTHNNLSALKGKYILIGYGLRDHIIHPDIVEDFIKKLNDIGIAVDIKQVKAGHLLSMFELAVGYKPVDLPFFN